MERSKVLLAIKKSLRHWYDNRHLVIRGELPFLGADRCELCVWFANARWNFSSMACLKSNCPIRKSYVPCLYHISVYTAVVKWCNTYKKSRNKADQGELIKAVVRMIRILEALRDDYSDTRKS